MLAVYRHDERWHELEGASKRGDKGCRIAAVIAAVTVLALTAMVLTFLVTILY